jgi:hypothetical protein
VLEAFEPGPVPVHLVYAARGPLPVKLRAFLDFATPRLRARLADDAPRRGAAKRGGEARVPAAPRRARSKR